MSRADAQKVVRIGGASAFLVDSALAVPQLLAAGGLDYLIFDYLAEASMGLLGRFQAADPAGGFGGDFLSVHVGPYLKEIARQGIKVVANAGGVNPAGLSAALQQLIAQSDLKLKVAYVDGDDLRGQLDALRRAAPQDMFTGAAFPEGKVISANAYLGAFQIAAALEAGADIVITGRVVDSALALGPLIHEFGWSAQQYDLLAAGTLAGHLLECGAQVTGGTFTDWQEVPRWEDIGFPIGECHADGTLILTKPPGSGGMVSVGTVAEQLLYEVSNPADYIVADVRCDFSDVTLTQLGPDRVRVSGARGRAPTDTYKVCLTYEDGWRAIAYQPLIAPGAGAVRARAPAAAGARPGGFQRHSLRHHRCGAQLRRARAAGCCARGGRQARGRSPGQAGRRPVRARTVDGGVRHVGGDLDQSCHPGAAGDRSVPVPHRQAQRHAAPDPGGGNAVAAGCARRGSRGGVRSRGARRQPAAGGRNGAATAARLGAQRG
jgi:hypothetical protein